jgi:hypothetical protein
VRSRIFRQFVSGALLVAAAAGGSLFLSGAADANPAPGGRGTLTFAPTTGLDTQIITATTSQGCDSQSNAADLEVTGPIGAATPTFPARTVITSTQNNNFSTTKSFTISLTISLKDAADVLHTTIQPGEYDFTVVCQDQIFLTEFGTFTGAISFTDQTHYNTGATPLPGSSPSPGASPTASPSPSASANPTPTDSPTPTSADWPTPSATPDSTTTTPTTSTSDAAGATTSSDAGGGTQPVASTGSLASTGAPIAAMFLGGLILLAAGLALVVWLKRPRRRS